MRYVKRNSLSEAQPLLADRAGLPVGGTAPSVMLETITANRGSSIISSAVCAQVQKPSQSTSAHACKPMRPKLALMA
jgi:hypothetical protein